MIIVENNMCILWYYVILKFIVKVLISCSPKMKGLGTRRIVAKLYKN